MPPHGKEKKMRTKTELKKIARTALKNEYGFQPPLTNITLIEANGNGTYILFRVNSIEYRFDSYTMGEGFPFPDSVWCGKGTINKK